MSQNFLLFFKHRLLHPAGDFFFRFRDAVFPLFFIPLALLFPPIRNHSSFFHAYGDMLAIALGLVGQAIRIFTRGYTNIYSGGVNKRVHAHELITYGMFACCRNPLYVGNLFLIASLLLLTQNPWAFALGAVFFVFVYISIVTAEEAYLRQRFGKTYEQYCQRVNRWFPDVHQLRRHLSESGQTLHFSWHQVLAKEYSSFYWWCVSVITVEAYKNGYLHWVSNTHPHYFWAILSFILATAGFGVIRYLKKSGQLQVQPRQTANRTASSSS